MPPCSGFLGHHAGRYPNSCVRCSYHRDAHGPRVVALRTSSQAPKPTPLVRKDPRTGHINIVSPPNPHGFT